MPFTVKTLHVITIIIDRVASDNVAHTAIEAKSEADFVSWVGFGNRANPSNAVIATGLVGIVRFRCVEYIIIVLQWRLDNPTLYNTLLND